MNHFTLILRPVKHYPSQSVNSSVDNPLVLVIVNGLKMSLTINGILTLTVNNSGRNTTRPHTTLFGSDYGIFFSSEERKENFLLRYFLSIQTIECFIKIIECVE